MIYGYINGQGLRLMTDSVIVASTIDYLEAKFAFSPDWNGLIVWAHFRQGSSGYSIRLTDGKIKKTDHLTLTAGEWSLFLHGSIAENGTVVTRITTETQTLSVLPCGTLQGEPFGEVPLTATEALAALIGDLRQRPGLRWSMPSTRRTAAAAVRERQGRRDPQVRQEPTVSRLTNSLWRVDMSVRKPSGSPLSRERQAHRGLPGQQVRQDLKG